MSYLFSETGGVIRRRSTHSHKPPSTTLVVTERAQPLPVTREPHIDDIVLGGREEEVALGVEDDLGEGALVSLEDDGFLTGSARRSAWVLLKGAHGVRTILAE
jgi:hypothetical protein